MADYVNIDAEYGKLKYTFDVIVPFGKYEAFYEFCFRKEENYTEQNMDMADDHEIPSKIVIFDEILSYAFEGKDTKIRKGSFIDTRTENVFVPVTKYESLIGKDKEVEMGLLVAKKMAINSSRSFIF